MTILKRLLLFITIAFPFSLHAQPANTGYQQPSEAITQTLLSTPPPEPIYHHMSQKLALVYSEATVTMDRLSQPTMGLAGFRFNPKTQRSGLKPLVAHIKVINIQNQNQETNWLPAQSDERFASPQFSPDGRYLLAEVVSTRRTKLALFDSQSGKSQYLNLAVNSAWGAPCNWVSNQQILCKTVKNDMPFELRALQQPTVLEHTSGPKPLKTYSNLLKNEHDEKAFEHYFSSNLVLVSVSGKVTPIPHIDGLISQASVSPNGEFIVIKRIHPPYSHLVRASRFPKSVEIWRINKTKPLYKSEVSGFNVETKKDNDESGSEGKPSKFVWRKGKNLALAWVEKTKNEEGKNRYHWMVKEGKLEDGLWDDSSPPKKLVTSKRRFREFGWTTGGTPYFSTRANDRKTYKFYTVKDQKKKLLASVHKMDKYDHPGEAIRINGSDSDVLEVDGKVFLSANGLSDHGATPFLSELDLDSGKITRLYSSAADRFEKVIGIVDANKAKWVTSFETMTKPPGYFLVEKKSRNLIYQPETPYPALDTVERKIVSYEREDGVKLQATLYAPKNSNKPLPTFVWIYPYEYSKEEFAEQSNIRWFRYHRLKGASPVAAALAGYAIIMNPSMPIIQEGDTLNNNYLSELKSNAQALVDHLVDEGISDKDRIAIGGQSYGAFSSANLLIHTDLFKTAFVESGAYNRTLTPFGFQRERRDFWEATQFYTSVSPFFHVDKLDKPICLMHGAEDENSGTFPIQSQRFFHALVGQGVKARYIELPYEGHFFRGRDTVLHTAYEMINWLDLTIGKQD